MTTNDDGEPQESEMTRRNMMLATGALTAPALFGIGDDNDLGFFDTHKVLDQEGDQATNFGIDPEALAFGRGLSVSDRDGGGVQINNTSAGAINSLDELPNVDVTALWQGPIADRPSASEAPDGSRYEATDQNLLYRNDPDNGWVVTCHGTESDPVPEGHYGSVDTEVVSNSVVYASQFETVQAALDDAGQDATIELPNETQVISNPPLTPKQGQTIRGSRAGSHLKLPNGGNTHIVEIAFGTTDIVFQNINFDGNGSNQDLSLPRRDLHGIQNEGTRITFASCSFVNGAKGAMLANENGTDITVSACEFRNNGKNGEFCDAIFNGSVKGLRVSGCYMANQTDTGVAQDNVQNTTVVGNVIVDGGAQGITWVKSSNRGMIANNIVYNCADDAGIFVAPFSGGSPTNCSITGNACVNNTSEGIRIINSPFISVMGNICNDNDDAGIYLDKTKDCMVVGNSCVNNGISSANAPGILIGNDGSTYSHRNIVGFNVLRDTADTQSYGIQVQSGIDNFNQFIGNHASGHVSGSWDIPGRENIREGNYPSAPIASGTANISAGGDLSVWLTTANVGYLDVHLLATGGTGQADWYTTTDGSGGTEVHVYEKGGANPVDVDWAIFP